MTETVDFPKDFTENEQRIIRKYLEQPDGGTDLTAWLEENHLWTEYVKLMKRIMPPEPEPITELPLPPPPPADLATLITNLKRPVVDRTPLLNAMTDEQKVIYLADLYEKNPNDPIFTTNRTTPQIISQASPPKKINVPKGTPRGLTIATAILKHKNLILACSIVFLVFVIIGLTLWG